MPRPNRSSVVLPGVPQHVILRGNNRRRLFSYPTCYSYFLSALGRSAELTLCAIHALALMANHVHLLVTPPTSLALSRFVHGFAQRYAMHRNRARGGTGKLFEERFKNFGLRDAQQYGRLHAYIELNPMRAGISSSPGAHPWTTYRLHSGEADRSAVPSWLWTPSPWWLGLGANDAERARVHREWIDECRPHHETLIVDEAHRKSVV